MGAIDMKRGSRKTRKIRNKHNGRKDPVGRRRPTDEWDDDFVPTYTIRSPLALQKRTPIPTPAENADSGQAGDGQSVAIESTSATSDIAAGATDQRPALSLGCTPIVDQSETSTPGETGFVDTAGTSERQATFEAPHPGHRSSGDGAADRNDADIPDPELAQRSQPRAQAQKHLWFPYIPSGGITVVVGTGDVASLIAINFAATVSAGKTWPNYYEQASQGVVAWFSTHHQTESDLRDQLAAAEAYIPWVKILNPQADSYGLPIRNLTSDVGRLTRMLSAGGKLPLVVLDHLSDYLMPQDFERSIRNLSHALTELQEIASNSEAALILPFKFRGRATNNMVTRAIRAFLCCRSGGPKAGHP